MRVDFLIIGQGIAGTTLAWRLLQRGRSVFVVDRENGHSSSRIAAGLMTPATGKRIAKSWRWADLFPNAVTFYRSRESELGDRFFHQRPALRLFIDAQEQAEYQRRSGGLLLGLVEPATDINAEWFDAPLGGFSMPDAARLDVPRYLDACRTHFRARDVYRTAGLSPHDLELTATGARVPALSVEAQTVVFCRGFDAGTDPWFGSIKFNAAKGEILTVRVPGLAENRVIHRGIWLAPIGDEVFRVGATYTWEPLDSRPTAEGRAEIESRLRAFLRLPFEVLEHHAAVRPVIDAGLPVLGRHPEHPQLAYFNGLGSKGSLLAPFFADQLAAHLCGTGEIDPEVNVRKALHRL
ncbi:bifunctional tRNA (mnm(5)s(2)U34)-methyltransferase/FAD-dependent cmnm(5)s(2)U34 oxidoreductase [Gemmata sp. SH-PL17]|uniref:NAD(P)/FAD-dependent oxidoreductase n=1 Tax=Gemmata sp. SH-PL17 TaxID=1630693 RepID=UPI0004B9007E|nr:FAD-dependent oxidoreductase [Gemmata sp. SH-PL17]AMV24465.1 bifunctional tRNA (mnm(5)s(2)U34)-methyltransferase/FAD-dependent cmnm(5)s(2)U34 oxidoreductase [Gemmata sp. SH-PL17]